MEQAEICLNDNDKFDEIYLKFKKGRKSIQFTDRRWIEKKQWI